MSSINRRDFLATVLAFGATVALPVNPVEATDLQIDQAWEEISEHPIVFDVDEFGTLQMAGIKEPEIRSDVYDISTTSIQSLEDLKAEIQGCYPLSERFNALCADVLDKWESRLHEDETDTATRRQLTQWIAQVSKGEDAWKDWIAIKSESNLSDLKLLIDEWLAEDINWNEVEWFASTAGSQGAAFQFFQRLPLDTLEALGVVIVEGDHPGSTYYGAELRGNVDEANEQARVLGWPIVFRA